MTRRLPHTISRRGILGLILASTAQAALAEPILRSPIPGPRPEGFGRKAIPSVEKLLAQAKLSGHVSFAVSDMKSTTFAEATAPIKRMPPASVAKAVTALYALEHLGADYRFATRVLTTGAVENGVLNGDLVLVGGGDPILDSDAMADLAQRVVDAGITRVTGRFLLVDTALPRIDEIDGTQTEYAGYNPTISGLNVNFNRVHFEWRRQGGDYSLKMDARARKYAPDVRIARMRVAARDVPVFDHEPGDAADHWTVARSALGNGGARWLPVRLPTLYAGEVFQAVARQVGLNLPRYERVDRAPEATERARYESAALRDIVRSMLKYSTNLTAEVIGLAATKTQDPAVTGLQGSAAAMNTWAREKFGLAHLNFVDHSGLGGASEVSASDLVRMLSAPGVAPLLRPLLKPIAMKDAQGKTDKTHPAQVAAKTGTLDFVSTLAGYVEGPEGTPMAFAIMAADLDARRQAKQAGAEVPTGARSFNKRAKALQQGLLERWVAFYAL